MDTSHSRPLIYVAINIHRPFSFSFTPFYSVAGCRWRQQVRIVQRQNSSHVSAGAEGAFNGARLRIPLEGNARYFSSSEITFDKKITPFRRDETVRPEVW